MYLYNCIQGSLILPEATSINQESRLIELEFQNERLKKQLASSIEPEKLQQIKDRLEDSERSKKSYEVSTITTGTNCLVLVNAGNSSAQRHEFPYFYVVKVPP